MKIGLIAGCLLLAVATIHCRAQDTGTGEGHPDKVKHPYDAMLALNTGIPFPAMAKAVKNNMGDLGFGIGALFLANPFPKSDLPLRLGGEIGYTYYGRFKTEVDINGFGGDYKTSYGIITLHAVARFRPAHTHWVTPFADVFAGGNFYVSTIKENLGFIESSLGLQSFDLGGEFSASFSRGVGAGISIGAPRKDHARFVLRLSYNMGSSIKYIVRNSLRYDQGQNALVYETGRAPVKYMMVQIGIGI